MLDQIKQTFDSVNTMLNVKIVKFNCQKKLKYTNIDLHAFESDFYFRVGSNFKDFTRLKCLLTNFLLLFFNAISPQDVDE